MIIARALTCGDPYRCNGFPNLLTESYNLHGCSHLIVSYNAERGDREEAPIHMPMIRLKTVENHRMYCLMPSDNFTVKKSGTQAGIEPTTFGVPTHCSNH